MKNKIVNKVDLAFSDALTYLGIKKGISIKNVCVRIRFIGEKKALELGLYNLNNTTLFNYKDLFSPKLTALRFSIQDLYFSFKAYYQIVKNQFKPDVESEFSILLYQSPKTKRPVLVGYIDKKVKHSINVSDLLAIIGIGDEQLN